ncbi:MAG: hypothetical protein ACOYNI_08440 [Acidimicrobiia bacterium]
MTIESAATAVGTIESGTLARVDACGTIELAALPIALNWWIGADDRWHDATTEVAVRQLSIGDAPVVETRMRVPGGDACARVYATADAEGVVIWEIANDSPSPFAAALVARPAGKRLPSFERDELVVYAAGRPLFEFDRRPGEVRLPGDPDTATDLPESTRGAAVAVVPVPHRSFVRVAITPGRFGTVDLATVAGPDDVARAWNAQLRRGLDVELPDARWQSAVQRARAEVLLRAAAKAVVDADVVVALEDWGFDAEATQAWDQLGVLAKRRAAQRSFLDPVDAFSVVERLATAPEAGPLADPARLLQLVRAVLVTEHDDGVDVLPFLPDAWRGASLDVRNVPTRSGSVSYAVRWHGERPALLWECNDRVALRAPGLSADWSTVEPAGEALL